jgi:hypothetical protein
VTLQLTRIQSYIPKDWDLYLIDNSLYPPDSKEIEQLCKPFDIQYLSAPSEFEYWHRTKHSTALDFAADTLKGSYDYFLILDSDAYPFQPCEYLLDQMLEYDICGSNGLKGGKGNPFGRYFHPSFLGVRTPILKDTKFESDDFLDCAEYLGVHAQEMGYKCGWLPITAQDLNPQKSGTVIAGSIYHHWRGSYRPNEVMADALRNPDSDSWIQAELEENQVVKSLAHRRVLPVTVYM